MEMVSGAPRERITQTAKCSGPTGLGTGVVFILQGENQFFMKLLCFSTPALPPAPREFAPPSWLVCSEDQVPVEEGTEGWPGASTSRGHLFIGEETLRELPGLPCAHSPCPMPLLSPKGSFWSAQGQIQSHLAPFSLLCLPWEPLGHTSATAPPW